MRQTLAILLLCLSCIISCKKDDDVQSDDYANVEKHDGSLARHWADITLYTIRNSTGNTPTYTSRSLGYMGLAMYESIVWGDPSYISLSGQLNGLTLPMPEAGKKYHWIISLNAAQQTMLKYLYQVPGNANQAVHNRINKTADSILSIYSTGQPAELINRSVQFGNDIAHTIYQWSLTDGGDKGYTRNFDPTFVFPRGPSYWIPPARGQTISAFPLHPYWGENRTFVKADGNIPIADIKPYSTNPTSAYYKLYKEVYDKDKILTRQEREIAAWWGDDPTETFSPPGHSYYLTSIAIKTSRSKLIKAAEAYAKTGMAIADAFINCWKVKYTYFNERPSSYVLFNIDNKWRQFWPEPPFPAFSSGHATQSAAAATVLSSVFGNIFRFTDDLHVGKRRFDDPRFLDLTYPARSFNSFWEFATECAMSRLYGGIHTRQDNEVGLSQGTIIGQNINALHWKK